MVGTPVIFAFALLLAAPALADADPSDGGTPAPADPFSFADFTWLNGNSRQTEFPLDGKVFSGEVTVDANYTYSFERPQDHSLTGSSVSARTNEIELTDLGVGGDFHYKNVRGRVMTQFGVYATLQPRNDATPSRGQYDLASAYRYLSEASGGYHFDVWNGINFDVGILTSYIGTSSYYNYENWVYQSSYISANTPWYFNGARLQLFPTDRLKLELWIVDGWQSFGTANGVPGVGVQVVWRPTGWFSFSSAEYIGADTLNTPSRVRLHDDTAIQIKYYEADTLLSRAAFSITADLGCETGGGKPGEAGAKVSCFGGDSSAPTQYFAAFMAYHRAWFLEGKFALTVGGGAMTNPGRYLVLLPPINGATATSGTPYFTLNPSDKFMAWDGSITFDWMPSQFITFRVEANHRAASVPYFTGRNGVTPAGGNQGTPGGVVLGFVPDLVKSENRFELALLVRL